MQNGWFHRLREGCPKFSLEIGKVMCCDVTKVNVVTEDFDAQLKPFHLYIWWSFPLADVFTLSRSLPKHGYQAEQTLIVTTAFPCTAKLQSNTLFNDQHFNPMHVAALNKHFPFHLISSQCSSTARLLSWLYYNTCTFSSHSNPLTNDLSLFLISS